jgi:hypothetical protein
LVLAATAQTATVTVFVQNQVARWKKNKRRKQALQISKYLRRLRSDLGTIGERADYIFAIATNQNPKAPFLLGSAPMLLDETQLQAYTDVYNDVLVQMRQSGENTNMIMTLIMGEEDFDGQGTFAGLANMNKRGNEVLTQQLPMSKALPLIREYVSETMKQLDDLADLLKSIEGK